MSDPNKMSFNMGFNVLLRSSNLPTLNTFPMIEFISNKFF